MIEKDKIQNIPWFTYAVGFVSVILYITMAVLSKNTHVNYSLFEKFGAPYAIQIYDGQYWGLISNSLIHSFPLHIIINLLGLIYFGTCVEKKIGWWRLFLFGLFASVFTSLIQLTFSNDAGIGLSGVNYALFGFLFFHGIVRKQFKMKLYLVTSIVMIAFVIYSVFMNIILNWYIGVEGQLSGFVFGILVGFVYLAKWKWISWPLLILTFGIALSTLFFAPWSSMWQCSRAIHLHQKGEIESAIPFYQEALEIEPTNKIALINLQQIQIDKWAKLAYAAHKAGKYTEAYRYYLRILSLDKNNAWARGNLKSLP